jgi:lipopolysaccharide/colanic/teichoic acid biosynthesis glycosyltransferase
MAVERAESVFFLDVDDVIREELLSHCYMKNKRTYIKPTFTGALVNTAVVAWISGAPMFLPKCPESGIGSLIAKRALDIAFSSVGILLSSWLMLIIYAAVRLYDRQPAVFRQTRVTKNGKLFTLFKFRSMRIDAESDGIPRLASKNDGRVTPVGRFIRKTRLDELPQLFNILSGDMSIVGPRPERPEIAALYERNNANFVFRTKVKAGLTGLAQVYGRYDTPPDEKLFLDIMYIERFSIWQDLKLILQTVKILFTPSSAEGVSQCAEEENVQKVTAGERSLG